MDTSVLSSTFLLTLLLAVGLFFFIRASVKDRTRQVQLQFDQAEEAAMAQLQQYFINRAYRVASVNEAAHQVVLEGFVRPSWFLAIFLTCLAAVGAICIALVLSILLPNFAQWTIALVLLSPLAGFFYWRGAARLERVALKVDPSNSSTDQAKSIVTVIAHRDELEELQRSLSLVAIE